MSLDTWAHIPIYGKLFILAVVIFIVWQVFRPQLSPCCGAPTEDRGFTNRKYCTDCGDRIYRNSDDD